MFTEPWRLREAWIKSRLLIRPWPLIASTIVLQHHHWEKAVASTAICAQDTHSQKITAAYSLKNWQMP